MLERWPNAKPGNGCDPRHLRRQRGRMWLALVVLLAALGVVLVKDHWLSHNSEDGIVDEEASTPATFDKSRPSEKKQSKSVTPANKTEREPSVRRSDRRTVTAAPPTMVDAHRPLVRALDVQVASGNTKRLLPAERRNALQVEIPANSGQWRIWLGTEPNAHTSVVTNAAERMPMPLAAENDREADDRPYPVLRKEMRARGSVVLQALVNAEGNIVDLRVLSGPAILAPAAREAVRKWRFKPYFQNGRAVETQAKITVNFLISTT